MEAIQKKQSQHLLFLCPLFHEKIWGGRRLETDFGYTLPAGPIGECWAISAHKNGDCLVANGPYKGEHLSQVWMEHPHLFLQDACNKKPFPLLVKIIDAEKDLSIQVHPDDMYAAAHEHGSLGKRECWYVLAANPGATIIVGQKAQTKEEFIRLMEEKEWSELLNEIPITKGDFFQIDPGTVHAIKGGTMVLETQQSSDVTYRLYDYDRIDETGAKRPLHIQQSLDTIAFDVPLPQPLHLDLFSAGIQIMEKNESYTVSHVCVSQEQSQVIQNDADFLCVSVIDGKGCVSVDEKEMVQLKKGDHFICPAPVDELTFSGALELIISHS